MIVYLIVDPTSKPVIKQEFATMEEAQAALPPFKAQVLTNNLNRFSINVVTQVPAGETWSLVVGEDYPENGDYRVFNQNTGQHETFTSFSQAVARNLELQQQWITEIFANQPTVIDPDAVVNIPTEGTQTL